YDAMVVGNHEFNFGASSFATMLGQLEFPLLGTANLDDDGSYGFVNDNIEDYINLDVDGKKVTIYGLTNPRVYRYELPTNIEGLTFFPAVDAAVADVPALIAAESPDLMVGLTHVGYQPYGGEIDSDELIAQSVGGLDVIIGGHSHTLLDPAVMVSDPTNNPDGTLVAHARRYAGYLGQVNVGWVGDDMVLREGFLIPTSEATVDPSLDAYLAPYVAQIDAYNSTVIGSTNVPIDGTNAYTEETNSANLQADAAVWELDDKVGVAVDIHLSGAMTNAAVAESGPYPATLTKGDMFDLMKYENSLVVLSMNGPEIKTILERSYDNWWWFSQGYPWGDRSHYTTCMLATDTGNVITYMGDLATEPDGSNVASLTLGGVPVDFADATTHYNVSTVNYVAAGSCNFNDGGVTLWPLSEIIADTQLYVRDSVINYIDAQPGAITPAVEGRLVFPTP
ncbi:MAG: 5'-nucleotidase C-terminal domain-containing protein, partial [Actinomycetota bacterium]